MTAVGPGFLVAMLGGFCTAALAFVAGLWLLAQSGHLPPPPISNVVCMDEKLLFLRRHQPFDPNFLVVGSSVAWRHFDGETAERERPGTRALNGGFCKINIAQTAQATTWLLSRLPNVRDLVLIASPQDFEACDTGVRAFDEKDADRFVFEHASALRFYFRYFDPVSLMRNARAVGALRSQPHSLNPMVFDRFGDGPVDTTLTHTSLAYGALDSLDERCFAALRHLALDSRRLGKRLLVVTQPVNPEWLQRYDAGGKMRRTLVRGIRAALGGTGASFWNALDESAIRHEAFTDAIHLRWSAARVFTAEIMRVRTSLAAPR